MTVSKPRLSLTRAQLATAVGAELSQLLETVTADGEIDVAEVQSVAEWLQANHHHKLPAIDHLLPAIQRVLADGVVSIDERTFLQKEIEAVLPPELRRTAQLNRREFAKREKERQLSEAAEAKREIAALAPAGSFDFMIAGVSYDGRADQIRSRYAEVETANVCFLRMPDNPHDTNAISITLSDGANLGYVPSAEAEWLTPLLDGGYRYEAYVKKILDGGRLPIPVVAGKIFAPNHPEQAGQPAAKTNYRASAGSGSGASGWHPVEVEAESTNVGVILFLAILIISIFGWIAFQR